MCYYSTSKSFWIDLNPLHSDAVLICQQQFNLIRIVCLGPVKAIKVKPSIKLTFTYNSVENVIFVDQSYLNTILQFCQSKGK